MKIDSAEFVLSAARGDQLISDDRPQVAFVGRSNVGKSSLMNRLLGRKGLARTSSTPGRTRLVNYFLIHDRFYFVDLPGYGYAKASGAERQRWADLVELYFQALDGRGTVVHLVDAKVGATALDLDAAEYLASFEVPVRIAATKIDKVSKNRRAAALAAIRRDLAAATGAEPRVVAVSARTGEGIKELWRELSEAAGLRPA